MDDPLVFEIPIPLSELSDHPLVEHAREHLSDGASDAGVRSEPDPAIDELHPLS
ncbi:hypothetical protein RIF23_20455 [Lipingzhangella sp. LS1_29]|uniref:Uncharacterized protein n=1 Tax=Lipingzhangella rawalii TaxID=2055835 RepID=A0ABU2HBK4_9ACTN|nr:hypothetical protein [Lipingzhangella rawalii]